MGAAATLWALPAAAEIDVVDYDIDVAVDTEARTLAATTKVAFIADGAATIDLDFVGLTVLDVALNDEEVPFERVDGVLRITPANPVADGTRAEIRVRYEGAPTPYVEPWGTWGVVFRPNRVFTVNVTHGARHWFPSHDVLADKATVTLRVDGPEGWLVAAPGALTDSVTADGRTAWTWTTDFPVPTYLIHFSLGQYELRRDEHDGVPYEYYLLPGSWERGGEALFAHAPQALALFTDRYGPYPFSKVAFDEIDLGGAVEQPSCVSIGSQIIQAGNQYDEVIAHEMAHAWFQGVVTIDGWEDLWLSEGLATYHEALYYEQQGGDLADYMHSLGLSYRSNAEAAEGIFPIYDPEVLFGVTTYRKGAWVFHTLAYGVVGTETFDDIIREWIERYRFASAGTEQFRAVAEDVAGVDLGWFFDEWVYGKGWPQYELGWRYRDGFVDIQLRQAQPDDWPTFTTAVTLRFQGDGPDAYTVLSPAGRELSVTYPFEFAPESVSVVPSHLHQVSMVPYEESPDPDPDPEPEVEPDPEPEPEPVPEPAPDHAPDVGSDLDATGPHPAGSDPGCGCTTGGRAAQWLARRR